MVIPLTYIRKGDNFLNFVLQNFILIYNLLETLKIQHLPFGLFFAFFNVLHFSESANIKKVLSGRASKGVKLHSS